MGKNLTQKLDRLTGISLKTRKAVYFLIDTALLLPVIIRHFSFPGVGMAVIILAMTFWLYVFKSTNRFTGTMTVSASAYLPALAVADIFVCAGIFYQELLTHFSLNGIKTYLMGFLEPSPSVGTYLLGISALLWVTTLKRSKITWFNHVAGTAFGGAILLRAWGVKTFSALARQRDATLLAILYLVAAFAWIVIISVSEIEVPRMHAINNMWTTVLLILLFFSHTGEISFFKSFLPGLRNRMLNLPVAALPLWQLILAVMVLGGCAVIMFRYEGQTLGCDAHVLVSVALGIVLLKALLSWYFFLNWLLVGLPFLIACLFSLHQEIKGEKSFRLPNVIFLPVLTGIALAAILLLYQNLYGNFLLSVAFGALFYHFSGKQKPERYKEINWYLGIFCIGIQAATYVAFRRFSLPLMAVIVTAVLLALAVMVIITWKYPTRVKAPTAAKAAVCVLLGLSCLISMSRYGSAITIDADLARGQVSVSAEAKGADNAVRSLTYQWIDKTGRTRYVEKWGFGGQAVLPLETDGLLVKAVDNKGETTVRIQWFPKWWVEIVGE